MGRRSKEAPQHVVMDSKESAFFTMWDAEARHHEGFRGRSNYARNAVVTEASRGHQFTESGAIVSCRDDRVQHLGDRETKLLNHFKAASDEMNSDNRNHTRAEKSKSGKRIFSASMKCNISVDGHTPVEAQTSGAKFGKKILPSRYENPNPIQIYDDVLDKPSTRSLISGRRSSGDESLRKGGASFRSSRSRSRLGLVEEPPLSSVRSVDSRYSTLSFDELEQKRTKVAQELERLERILNGSEQYTGQ